MKNNLLENNSVQQILTFVSILVVLVSVVLYNKIQTQEQYYKYQTNVLANQYFIYKKLFDDYAFTNNMEINNPNYVDRTKMVDELAMSTPFMMDKNKKLLPKKLITFNYLRDSMSESLNKKQYEITINEKQNKMVLKGVLNQTDMVEIEYDLNDYTELDNSISNVFVNSWIILSIVLLMFVYALFTIKNFLTTQIELKKKFITKEKEIEKMAFVDTLTGASSRLKFNLILDDILHIARRFNHKFSLVMFDIDHFKSFNDKYGHDVGDFVLKEVSFNVKHLIRETDTFARWGGEEFMIILPYTDLDNAVMLTSKIQKSIESLELADLPKVTCSFGVVEYALGNTKEDIIKTVDEKLYLAKNSGRNCIKF